MSSITEHADHRREDHEISGSPYEQMRRILARHLCGWITGHGAPLDHMLADADMVLAEAHEQGLRFHMAGTTESAGGFVEFVEVELVADGD